MVEFKAEKIDGQYVVKAVPVRRGDGSLEIHVPAVSTIAKFIKDEELKQR